jgi:hypothetical protein
MNKTFTFILSLLFLANGIFSQSTLPVEKTNQRQRKEAQQMQSSDKNLIGNITCHTRYIAEQTMLLKFTFTFSSPDYEYVDGVALTFPDGMTPIANGTTNPLATPNLGCPNATIDLQEIIDQTVVWGQIEEHSACGALVAGTYVFFVAVEIGELLGDQEVGYLIFGDGYGADPHIIEGVCTILEAYENDIAITGSNLIGFYNPDFTVVPQVFLLNLGSQTQFFHVNATIMQNETEIYNSTSTELSLSPNETMIWEFVTDWVTANGLYNATFSIVEDDEDNSNNILTQNISVIETKNAYAWNAYDPNSTLPTGPVIVTIPAGTVSNIATATGDFITGADFVFDEWYGISNTGKLNRINTATGALTLIGNTGLSSTTGLTFDITTTTLFLSAWDGSNSKLYSLDLTNATPTLIGTTINEVVIGIASNNAGELYGITLGDNLISINKTTGNGTVIGSLGVDINYAQDIAYDRDMNILYGTLYTTSGYLASIDITTGTAKMLTNFEYELTGFAIPYSYELPETDVFVQTIFSIASGCGLADNQQIKITVKNMGITDQQNIPVSYKVNNSNPIIEVITGPIASGDSYDYIFLQTADFSAPGTYTITACTHLDTDENISNDCKEITFVNYNYVTIPYSMGFETTDNYSNWKIFDVNGDNVSWRIGTNPANAQSGTQYAMYLYNTDGVTTANDWFISTCIELKADEDYGLSFWYRVGEFSSVVYPEKLKVAIGTEQKPDAMTTVIHDLGTLNNTSYKQHKSNFQVPADGIYYIGWHVYSAPDMFYLLLDNIKIQVTTGIEKSTQVNMIIYPNPTQDIVQILSDEIINTIRVFNTLGQIVYSIDANASVYNMNLGFLHDGFYIVEVSTANGTINKQIVISK